ncbi:MAG TPA: cysteine--tRNA ligase [Bacteriovoracaceae bacterium]|nr:cysteine--tRNA ligase [Bacteriovoracaceae bacterium]
MAREIKIHNNLTRKKEVLKTVEPGQVKFYSCGPTTYDFSHIGNGRSFVVADLFHRVLKNFGYKVNFVRNYTDVDDNIIKRAHEMNRDPILHAAIFVKECETDMLSLGMLPPTHTPKVSESMPEIIKMIEDIIENGNAYVREGEVFFSVPSFNDYGKLSKKDLETLQHGIRVEVDNRKKNPADFVLWKPAKPGEPFWDSPWSQGRPGWHIECSAMAKKFLGSTLDLHHGGIDLMFPHHENEIAQSEAANKCSFCNAWAHNEFLNFGTEKMSKSLGNVVKIRDFVKTYHGQVLRHIYLSVHYRARLEWTEEVLQRAIEEVKRIHEFAVDIKSFKASNSGSIDPEIDKCIEKMCDELSNDFNSAGSMGHFFTFLRYVRGQKDSLSEASLKHVHETVKFMHETLGLISHEPQAVLDALSKNDQNVSASGIDAAAIEKLIEERKEAKAQKNWGRADEIRKELATKKIIMQDNPDGSVSWKVEQ